MAHQNMQYIQGPQMDWTEDAGLHQRFKDWREEVEKTTFCTKAPD